MRTNTTKAKLAEGKFALGAIINGYAPDQVELFGAIGYDFVMIDCEHGAMSVDQVENMVRAAEVFGITPFARIPNHEDSTILRQLFYGSSTGGCRASLYPTSTPVSRLIP